MAKYKQLHDPKKFGFKNKTRGGYRAYIFRTDSTNKKGCINGVVLEGAQVTVRTWKDNGGYYDSGLISPFDLIPLKDKKAIPEPVEKPKPEYEVGRFYHWSGGECPVSDDTEVILVLSHYSDLVRKTAKYTDWGKRDHNQIIAFLVVSYA